MYYPSQLQSFPDKLKLLECYKGKKIEELPTPAFVVDREIFGNNCQMMLKNSKNLNADFRAHVKTHKTIEGTVLQLGSGPIATNRVVVSTMLEAWGLMPLIEEGIIKDVLFSLPVIKSRLNELADFAQKVVHLRLMLDHPEQLELLRKYSIQHSNTKKWSIFIKINMGTNRAGFDKDSDQLIEALTKASEKSYKEYIEIYGFYAHAGHSYSSGSKVAAKHYLLDEIWNVNKAAQDAYKIDSTLASLQLSVGATPTALASEILSKDEVTRHLGGNLNGNLELHAGNYPFCDLQQVATACISYKDVSCRVMAEVTSTYENRGKKTPGEQLINAGVIALAREPGPIPGYGRVLYPEKYKNWIVERLSQEHGICVPLGDVETEMIPLNTVVSIVPQHSCITAAAYPWYYITDASKTVVDVWIPYRGW